MFFLQLIVKLILFLNFCKSDLLVIRHGRSRVRHSSEKDHIKWGLQAFDNLTLDYEFDQYEQNDTMDIGNNNTYIVNGTEITSQIYQSGIDLGKTTNNVADIDYVTNTKREKDLINNLSGIKLNSTITNSTLSSTSAAKKKIGKKEIMANIRKTIDKGLEYLKSHANLSEVNISVRDDEKTTTKNSPFTITTTTTPRKTTTTTIATTKKPNDVQQKIENQLKTFHINQSVTNKQKIQLNNEISGDKNLFYRKYSSSVEKSNENDTFNPSEFYSDVSINNDDSEIDENIETIEQIDNLEDLSIQINGPNEFDDISLTNELDDLDEISRTNRINLLKGRDVVTRFLQIVESQHLLGANCTAGTALNLGEGVVDQYAQDRFRVEAEIAVNRANMLTRLVQFFFPIFFVGVENFPHFLIYISILIKK